MDASQGIDEALRLLTTLDSAPVSEHAAVYEQAHARVRAVLDGTPAVDRFGAATQPDAATRVD